MISKNLKVLFFSSLIIPFGILASFRLTGVLRGPIVVSETITAPTVEWEMEKPSQDYGIQHSIENSYNSTEISAISDVLIAHYDNGPGSWLWSSWDEFMMEVNGTVSVPQGHIAEVDIEFHGNNDSAVDFSESEEKYGLEEAEYKNLSLTKYGDVGDSSVTGDLKAFVNLVSTNDSQTVYFWINPFLGVRDKADQPNTLQTSVQITYFNGSTYKRVVLPTIFTVMPDAGGDFKSARLIDFGNYTGFIDPLVDKEDYYKIWLDANQSVRIKLFIPEPLGSYMNLYFYDPNRNLASNSSTRGTATHTAQIEYDVPQSGYWYIKAMPYDCDFLYDLSVEKVG